MSKLFRNATLERKEMYENPDDKNVMKNLTTCATIGDVVALVDRTFPTWIVSICDAYSDDYDDLTRNWHACCDKLDVAPRKIFIVDDVPATEDSSKSFLLHVIDILSATGSIVRRVQEFSACPSCRKAIPTKESYEMLKSRPSRWSPRCQGCC